MNDVVLSKKISIERCIGNVRTYYKSADAEAFDEDFLRQDAISLNLQRACQLCVDLANYTIKTHKLGAPSSSSECFAVLADAGVISKSLATTMVRMVGFRNVLVHEYRELDLNILKDVIENRLEELLNLTNCVVRYFESNP